MKETKNIHSTEIPKKQVKLFDTTVDLLTRNELVNEIVVSSGEKRIFGCANIKAFNLIQEDQRFANYYQQCSTVYCDGFGALLGARLLGYSVNKNYRNTCADFLDLLLDKLRKDCKKIYFWPEDKRCLLF